MPSPPVLFAFLTGASAAAYVVCVKLGSGRINAALGAMIIAGVAFLVNTIAALAMHAQGREVVIRRDAVLLLCLAGVAAGGVDILGMLAYGRGLRVSASLIMTGTSTALVLLVGFFAFKEPVTWPRLLAIGLIAAGILLLQAQEA